MSSLRNGKRLLCRSSAQLKRGPEASVDEPKAKKGSVASTKEPTKGIELKSASEVAKESAVEETKAAGKAEETSKAEKEKGEKKLHTPRSGLVLKSSEEVQMQDAGEKAPHGESSEGDDEQLAEDLRKASSAVTLTPRQWAEKVSGPHSDEVAYDEDEEQSVIPSSKVTVIELEEDPYAPSQVSKITDPEEVGKRRRKSRSKLAKKAARMRRRHQSPGPSVQPRREAEEDEESASDIDLDAFEGLKGLIPDAREAFAEMADLAKGYKAQSESARTSVSRMESLMVKMGQEHMNMKKNAEMERKLMRRENRLLKRTLGLVRPSRESELQAVRDSTGGQASGSRGDDPEARSRPGSARTRD